MRTLSISLNKARNVTLTAYLQEVDGPYTFVTKRPAVLILPGGGYTHCSSRESDPVAFPYLAVGYQVFILRYSVAPHATWPNPLEDYDQAMAIIRNHADEWSLYPDKIAVIGFSAGGHLAACAATMAKERPNALILGYAVTGEMADELNPGAPDAVAGVSADTCPCFIFASRSDGFVKIANSLRFIVALEAAGVPFECHLYSDGPHGFITADPSVQPQDGLNSRLAHWVPDSISWLRDLFGNFTPDGMSEPRLR